MQQRQRRRCDTDETAHSQPPKICCNLFENKQWPDKFVMIESLNEINQVSYQKYPYIYMTIYVHMYFRCA